MTVQSTTRRNDYIGNGATANYTFTFRIFAATDLLVTKKDTAGVETTLVYPTDYSVTGVGLYSGGSITLTAGVLPTNYRISLRFRLPLTQLADIRNQGGYYPDVVENALDRLDMIALQHQDEIDRSVKLPETEPDAMTLPTIEIRKSNFLAFNAEGRPIAAAGVSSVPISSFMATLVDDTTAAAALTTLGVNNAAQFLPHDAATPDLTVLIDAGKIIKADGTLVSQAQQTATFVAPAANPRIDRIVVDMLTGVYSIIAGTEAASPVAPAITAGKLPCAQVSLIVGQTQITNANITDERTALVSTPQITNHTATGTDTYTVSGLTLVSGFDYRITFTNGNSIAAPTLNGTTIVKIGGGTLLPDDIRAGHQAVLRHDGSRLVLLNPWQPDDMFVDIAAANGRKRSRSADLGLLEWSEARDSPILVPGAAGQWNELKGDTGGTIMIMDGRWWYWHGGRNAAGLNTIGLHITSGSTLTGMASASESPVVTVGAAGAWDETAVGHPLVMYDNGKMTMWYTGYNAAPVYRIGRATSQNGRTWTKDASPVFGPGAAGAWDEGGVDQPSVIWDGDQYVMAYRGWAAGAADTTSRIGIATSPDGIAWTRHANNPVLTYGPAGAWDEHGLLAPRIWRDGSTYYMNYSGKYNDANKYSSVGHATATNIGTWAKDANNPLLDEKTTPYIELEWGNPVKINGVWFLLCPAFFDDGKTTLWRGL